MKQNKWKHLKFEKYVFVLLLSIELIMSFTFLGFIHIDPISLTTAYIPIVVAGCYDKKEHKEEQKERERTYEQNFP